MTPNRWGSVLGALSALTWHRSRSPVFADQAVFDVAVVGGGLVGLAVAREIAARGSSVVVLERENAVAASASSGNTGLGHTGYDAPVGSLERRLLRQAVSLHPSLYRSFGLDLRHVRKCGSLVVAWSPEQLERLQEVLEANLRAGDTDAYMATPDDLHHLEPELATSAIGAVVCPNEAVVEPWLIPIGYAEACRLHGAEVRLSTEVTSARRDHGVWCLGLSNRCISTVGRSWPGEVLVQFMEEEPCPKESSCVTARIVVNCGGVLGDKVEELRVGADAIPFHVTPRKGQFLVLKTKAELSHIIETVPTQFTKGVIVWTTVYGNLVVGPTAVDQTSRSDRSTDLETMRDLRLWVDKVVPAARDADVVGTYSGLRPATEFRDYCIQSHSEGWITVGGIRSTGLSCCCAIGEHVADLVDALPGTSRPGCPTPGIAEAKVAQRTASVRVNNGCVPDLAELAAEYRANGDGTVTVYGRRWRVSHPLSSFGMETYTGSENGVTS